MYSWLALKPSAIVTAARALAESREKSRPQRAGEHATSSTSDTSAKETSVKPR